MRDLFSRDVERVELPPPQAWIPTMRTPRRSLPSGLVAIPALAGVIGLALVAAFVIQLVRGDLPPQVGASASPTTTASESSAATSSARPAAPSATVTPAASPTPAPAALPSSDAVRVTNTLPATGQWALVLRRNLPIEPGSEVFMSAVRDSITAVPLRGGEERPLLDFVGIAKQQNRASATNLLREQLSPDGRRIVLSVFSGEDANARVVLVIVDLVNGTVSQLVSDAAYHYELPAWSPRGDLIAFARKPAEPTPAGFAGTIWVVRPDGTGLRQVLGPSTVAIEGTSVLGWNGDGSRIAYLRGFEGSPYYLLDPATGNSTTVSGHNAALGTIADWREGTPAFAGALMEGNYGSAAFLVTAGQDGANARDIVTDRTNPHNTSFNGARWRPRSNDIMFTQFTADGSGGGWLSTIQITDASGRAPQAVANEQNSFVLADWTADGRDVAYVSGTETGAGGAFLVSADGTNKRRLASFTATAGFRTQWLQLAVLSF
jgi:Tol biopolymer transport system component